MRTLLLSLVLLALPATARAQAWSPEPGHGYAKGWLRWLPGMGHHPGPVHGSGPLFTTPVPTGHYHELFAGMYLEVGLVPRVAVSVQGDALRLFLAQDARDGSAHAFVSPGEPTFAARVQLVQGGPFALSVEAFVRPSIIEGGAVMSLYAAEDLSPTGELTIATGELEGGGAVHAGLGLGRTWIVASLALVGATGGWDTSLEWHAKIGRTGKRGNQWRLRVSGKHPLGDGSAPYHNSPSGIGNGTRYLAICAELLKPIGGGALLGLSVAGGFATSLRQTSGPVLVGFVEKAW